MAAFTGLPVFEYVKAKTAAEVFRVIEKQPEKYHFLSGGTDLFLQMRNGSCAPEIVVDLKALPGMKDLSFSEDSGLVVGGAVTINRLAAHSQVIRHYPLLVEAARSMASYQLCSRATLAGNLCNGSPAADMAPAALILGAQLELVSSDGERMLPIEAFFLGPGKTALQPGEFLQTVVFPVPEEGTAAHYFKLGRNKAGDLAVAGAAVLAYPDDVPGGFSWRIALASVAPTPMRAWEAEQLLNEQVWSPVLAEQAADAAARAAKPIDDVRASAAYRRAMVRTQTLRAIKAVHADLHKEAK